jgi:hypothetical protein
MLKNEQDRRLQISARQNHSGLRKAHLFLCLFFLSFFLRLWVAIFRSFRFLPQGTWATPFLKTDWA